MTKKLIKKITTFSLSAILAFSTLLGAMPTSVFAADNTAQKKEEKVIMADEKTEAVSDEFVIKIDEKFDSEKLEKNKKIESVEVLTDDTAVVTFKKETTEEEQESLLKKTTTVEKAEPNIIFDVLEDGGIVYQNDGTEEETETPTETPTEAPTEKNTEVKETDEIKPETQSVVMLDVNDGRFDDTYYERQYYLGKSGFLNSLDKYKTYEKRKVKIAVIDTGVNIEHRDIKNIINKDLSVNVTETDEEGNYKPCTNDKYGENGHGTGVVSLIASEVNNAEGIAGTTTAIDNEIVDIFMVQVLDKDGRITLANLIKGVKYAIDNNVDIINMSLGSYSASGDIPTLKTVINEAVNSGIIVVSAAGNGTNNKNTGKEQKTYPAAYSNVLGVMGMDKEGYRSEFSDYGDWYDVYSYAEDIIMASSHDDGYCLNKGNSFATALVTAQAAYLSALNPKDEEKNKAKEDETEVVQTAKAFSIAEIFNFFEKEKDETKKDVKEEKYKSYIGEFTGKEIVEFIKKSVDSEYSINAYDALEKMFEKHGKIATGEKEEALKEEFINDEEKIVTEEAKITDEELFADSLCTEEGLEEIEEHTSFDVTITDDVVNGIRIIEGLPEEYVVHDPSEFNYTDNKFYKGAEEFYNEKFIGQEFEQIVQMAQDASIPKINWETFFSITCFEGCTLNNILDFMADGWIVDDLIKEISEGGYCSVFEYLYDFSPLGYYTRECRTLWIQDTIYSNNAGYQYFYASIDGSRAFCLDPGLWSGGNGCLVDYLGTTDELRSWGYTTTNHLGLAPYGYNSAYVVSNWVYDMSRYSYPSLGDFIWWWSLAQLYVHGWRDANLYWAMLDLGNVIAAKYSDAGCASWDKESEDNMISNMYSRLSTAGNSYTYRRLGSPECQKYITQISPYPAVYHKVPQYVRVHASSSSTLTGDGYDLTGAQFTISYGGANYTVTIDSDGYSNWINLSDDGPIYNVTVKNIKEPNNGSYDINDTSVTQGQCGVSGSSGDNYTTIEIKLTPKGKLRLHKSCPVDGYTASLGGAIYRLYDSATGGNQKCEFGFTDDGGTTPLTGWISPGEYYLEETTPPSSDAYIKNSDRTKITVDAGNPNKNYYATGTGNTYTADVLTEYPNTANILMRVQSTEELTYNGVVIPHDLEQLEYIESNGSQYIDTGYIPTANFSTKIIASNSKDSAGSVLGVTTGNEGLELSSQGKQMKLWNKTSGSASQTDVMAAFAGVQTSNEYYITRLGKNATVTTNNKTNTLTTSNSVKAMSKSLYVFASHADSDTAKDKYSGKLTEISFYEDGSKVKNFVPVVTTSVLSNTSTDTFIYKGTTPVSGSVAKGTVGLYDTLENKLYLNSGSGSFTAGPKITNAVYVDDEYYLLGKSEGGQATPKALLTENGTLTFVYNDIKYNLDNEITIDGSKVTKVFEIAKNSTSWGWKNNTSVKKVVFDFSFSSYLPTNLTGFLSGLSNLKKIENIKYLNLSNVTSVKEFFKNCSSIEVLNLSDFAIKNIATKTDMFSGCSKLIEITISDNFAFASDGRVPTLPTKQGSLNIPAGCTYNGKWHVLANNNDYNPADVVAPAKDTLTYYAYKGKVISFSKTDYGAPYDGALHTGNVTVTTPDKDYIIKYSENDSEYTMANAPEYLDGNHIVYFEISAPGYTTAHGSFMVNISKNTLTGATVRGIEDHIFEGEYANYEPWSESNPDGFNVIDSAGNILIPNVDYTWKLNDDNNPIVPNDPNSNYSAQQTITFTGIGKYNGSVSVNYTETRKAYSIVYENCEFVPNTYTKYYGIDFTITNEKPEPVELFTCWYETDDEDVVTTYASGSVFKGNRDLHILPQWRDAYTVAYSKGNATSGTVPTPQTIEKGQKIVIKNNTDLARSNEASVSRSVMFNANGGSLVKQDGLGSDGKMVVASTNKFTFNKWYANEFTDNVASIKYYTPGQEITPSSNLSLRPVWNKSRTYSAITLPAATKTGKVFDGWYNEDGERVGGAGDSYVIPSETKEEENITDLTDYVWIADSTLNKTYGLSNEYKVDYKSNSRNYTSLSVIANETSNEDEFDINVKFNTTKAYTSNKWDKDAYKTIEFNGGMDIKNPFLIGWLSSNGNLIKKSENTALTLKAGWADGILEKDLINAVYPEGTITLSTSGSYNPSSLYAGTTWTAVPGGRTLMAVDSGNANYSTTKKTGGGTGIVNLSHYHGTSSATLSSSYIPSHTHSVSFSGSTNSAGAHTHGFGVSLNGNASWGNIEYYNSGSSGKATSEAGAHTHTFSGSWTSNNAGGTSSHSHGNTGSNLGSYSIRQKYYVANIQERTSGTPTTSNYIKNVAEAIEKIYPTGIIIATDGSFNPNTAFAGTTWEQVTPGYSIISAGTLSIDTSQVYSAGSTGGADSINLSHAHAGSNATMGTIPTHAHTLSVSGTLASAGNHSHNIPIWDNAGTRASAGYSGTRYSSGSSPSFSTGSAGAHSHTVTIAASTTGNAGSSGSHNHGNTGSALGSSSVVEPYKTAVYWYRTGGKATDTSTVYSKADKYADKLLPKGIIVFTTSSASNIAGGGTWDAYTAGRIVTTSSTAGSTGGSATVNLSHAHTTGGHTITSTEMTQHAHSWNAASFGSTTCSNHTHSIYIGSAAYGGPDLYTVNGGSSGWNTVSAGAHTHTVSVTGASCAANGGGASHSHGDTGGASIDMSAVSLVQPYYTCNIYVKTAASSTASVEPTIKQASIGGNILTQLKDFFIPAIIAAEDEEAVVPEEELENTQEETDDMAEFYALAVEEFNEENGIIPANESRPLLMGAFGADLSGASATANNSYIPGAKFKVERQLSNGGWEVVAQDVETDANGNVMLNVAMDSSQIYFRITLTSAPHGYELKENTTPVEVLVSGGRTFTIIEDVKPKDQEIENTRTYSTNAALTGRVNDEDTSGWLNPFFSLKTLSDSTKAETGRNSDNAFDTIGLFTRNESEIRQNKAINAISTHYADSDNDDLVSRNSGFVDGTSIVPIRAVNSSQSIYGKNYLAKGSGSESKDILFASGDLFKANTTPFKYNDTPADYGSVTFTVTGMVQEDATAVFRLCNSINGKESSIIDMDVLVPCVDGRNTMTLHNMPVGEYIVTLNNKNWTWRYNSVTISSNNDEGKKDNDGNLIIKVERGKDVNIRAHFVAKNYIWRSGSDLNGDAKDFGSGNYIYNYQTSWINQGGHYTDITK